MFGILQDHFRRIFFPADGDFDFGCVVDHMLARDQVTSGMHQEPGSRCLAGDGVLVLAGHGLAGCVGCLTAHHHHNIGIRFHFDFDRIRVRLSMLPAISRGLIPFIAWLSNRRDHGLRRPAIRCR